MRGQGGFELQIASIDMHEIGRKPIGDCSIRQARCHHSIETGRICAYCQYYVASASAMEVFNLKEIGALGLLGKLWGVGDEGKDPAKQQKSSQ
jgi:hypothetical protein